MSLHLTLLDLLVVAAYFLATMGIGFAFWKKSKPWMRSPQPAAACQAGLPDSQSLAHM